MAATKKATATSSDKSPSQRAREKGPATYDRLKKKSARTKRVPIVLDDELAERVDDLRKQVDRDKLMLAKMSGNGAQPEVLAQQTDQLETAQRELAEAREKLAENTVTMVFRSVGRKRFDALKEEHPPTREQKSEAKKEERPVPEFDIDTFPAALVAVSCVEPRLDGDAYEDEDSGRTRYPHAEDIFDEWNDGELGVIFTAAYEVNTQRRVVTAGEG